MTHHVVPDPLSTRVLLSLARLGLYVWIGTFAGAVFEYRGWIKWFAVLAKPLMKLARISELAAASFLSAIVSNYAANAMVAGARAEGEISRRELIVCGVANAFPTKISHFMRILFPLVGMIGLPGALYAGIQFFTGALRTVLVWIFGAPRGKSGDSGGDAPPVKTPDKLALASKAPLSWRKTLWKASKRSFGILARVGMISAPMYIIVSFLGAFGFFTSWRDAMPAAIAGIFPPGVMTVVAARLGGLLSAAAAAVELRSSGALNDLQITAAFMIGNMLTNPIRAVRRNLPAALGIFPGQDGLIIVLIVQIWRFFAAAVAVAVLLALGAGGS